MSKNEFLYKLKKKLRGVPKNELEERLNFYSEMIDDRIEDGMDEKEAIKNKMGKYLINVIYTTCNNSV